MASYEDLLAFWLTDDPARRASKWFAKDLAFDAEVRNRFAPWLEQARRGELNAWRDSPRGAAGFVILTDQVPRNVFRGTAQAFAFDDLAIEASLIAQAQSFDASLGPFERWMLYMPMMHAEDRDIQRRSVEAFSRLAKEAPREHRALFESAEEYAVRHRDIVERFGRFLHRNAVLGRVSTPKELAFLQQPGSSF